MADEGRIIERAEGARAHLWWDTERHFPFLSMQERGWSLCPYCGGFKFKGGEKFIFPNHLKDPKGEDLPVEKDIGCRNFSPKRKAQIQAEPKAEASETKPETKQPERPSEAPEPPEKTVEKKGKRKGLFGK